METDSEQFEVIVCIQYIYLLIAIIYRFNYRYTSLKVLFIMKLIIYIIIYYYTLHLIFHYIVFLKIFNALY